MINTNEVLLKCKGIKKVFRTGRKDLEVLRGIDLTIAKGSIHTIIGPSGAGKSTLLHILGGLDKPTEGEVTLDNNNLYKSSDTQLARIRNQEIGFIFQFHHLLPEFSALENVMMPSIIDGTTLKRANEFAADLLGKVGLRNRLDHKPNELSGGEKQRVAVARALVNKPSIIFADEPTGNLDRQNSEMLLSLLFSLYEKENITLIVVTHNERIAGQFKNKVRIEDGKIIG